MLVNAHRMLTRASLNHYAIGQFNINNLEWIKAIARGAQQCRAPLMLGITEAACAWMGGPATVQAMVAGMLRHLDITIPVALHLDHASFAMCLQAIGAGFSSVMFDGSKMPFQENLALCRKLAPICNDQGVSLEAELGSPGGEEDGISGSGEKADPEQCGELAETGITALAASIGNMHGQYPENWQGLDFELLRAIKAKVGSLPLALHGGSGIPAEMIAKAISLGISKINVNTECQMAFARALGEYFRTGMDKEPKGYSLQKLMSPGIDAITATVVEKIRFFGCENEGQVA